MNTIQDLKWARLMMLIWVVLSVIVIGGYFGFKQLQKGTTLTNLVQDGLTQNSTFHAEVSAAPTILDKVKDKDIDAKKLDNSSLLYVFNETYENLEFSKKVKDETLANHFTDGKRKLVLFTSHPTTVANYSGVIELNSDWSAKLDNKVFSPRELKFQNTRLKGEYVSGIWFGLFSSEEAERLQKSTFPNAIKVKVKENKYLLVTEGIGEGTYGKTANVSLVDADAIPDDPNNQGAISAIIPGLTDADNKTWTIDERVGEIIYQSDGTVKINSHFTTPNATVKGVLNVRVVSQDKIEATVDHYGEVKCHDPVNFTLHNQDCVALPRDQTPAWKDDKIKELEKQVKEVKEIEKKLIEKEKENKKFFDSWMMYYKCIENDSHSKETQRRNFYTDSHIHFKNDEDCLGLKHIHWGVRKEVNYRTGDRFWANIIEMEFHKNSLAKNEYLRDLENCVSSWEANVVCTFRGDNPTKLKELYMTTWSIWETAKCRRHNYYRICEWASGWRGSWVSLGEWDTMLWGNFFRETPTLWWLFTVQWSRDINFWFTNLTNFFKKYQSLIVDIQSFTSSLSNNNIQWDKSLVKTFKIVGLKYAEHKNISGFKTNICMTNLGCYWVDNDLWKIKIDNWEIKELNKALEVKSWKTQDYSKSWEWYKRYGLFYISSNQKPYGRDSINPDEFKSMILFQ